ncbi:MAG: NAD-glutamate dehydrogenase domain-containing protein [Thermodesulfobacteriota bacterium]
MQEESGSRRGQPMTGEAAVTLGLVKERLAAEAESLAPWFFASMPAYYFRTHSQEEQVRHLHALISGQVLSEGQRLAVRSPCGDKVTYISPGRGGDELAEVLSSLRGQEILNARIYESTDGKLRLDTFVLSPQEPLDVSGESFRLAVEQMRGAGALAPERLADFSRFLAAATGDCVEKFEPERALRHFALWEEFLASADRERVLVRLDPEAYPGLSRVVVALTSPARRGLLLEMVRILRRERVHIARAYGDVYAAGADSMGVCSFYVTRDGAPLDPAGRAWRRLSAELAMVKQIAGHELERLADEAGWSLRQVAFLQAAAEFGHQFLLRQDIYAYTAHHMVQAVLANRAAARAVLDLFEARFNPVVGNREAMAREYRARLLALVEGMGDEVARHTFACMEALVSHTLRTNYYLPGRLSLGFRLDPAVLDSIPGGPVAQEGAPPYGFFFFSGPFWQGFHVRYREMARGGVRVVPTRTQEQFELESNRLWDEVTALAKAQQHKNKDIPEGGAKAVLLLGPEADADQAVKGMADALLDLIVVPEDAPAQAPVLPGVVDYLNREEIIYLGPDEHITPAHIEWIVARAAFRGYRYPAAFMSSKPRTGISHKRYGVTSLGVVVFAEEILRSLLGLDPRSQRFTVKITGGPRGDVAGNAMRLLMRDYGEKAAIVAVSDGHGAACDPAGLDHAELARLIDGDLSIAEFDPARLSGDGVAASTSTPEGARLRDTLHNTVRADLFLPCGGRPDTINLRNWGDFLDAEGKPTARVVVEGANLFLSPEARDRLQEAGILAVHGSSANKCGVICSSYEVLAGLTLSDQEFLAVKDEYVAQVLDILRERAAAEARLLVREYKARGGTSPLTAITVELSKEINTLADLVYARLARDVKAAEDIREDPALHGVLLAYCPPVLARRYADRLIERVPLGHLLALLSAATASRIVYNEGVGWLTRMAAIGDVGQVVRAYLAEDARLAAYLEELAASSLPDREAMARILAAAGRKHLTAWALGVE